ncbi:hypothetical protein NLX86_04325 [Streptomyces sp. A3M-1-3]|uniref:hypothetical protein n=1 Tax=Streptomyces sp. A3M-1-3 TaxID=2962044 RepID=UPI0020B6D438|nr:hypothetical protein [Streptomyces sp. A3M-1-3]MCP3817392.1 hypothetical protein [Streptomyces sp. A3M-1-3]
MNQTTTLSLLAGTLACAILGSGVASATSITASNQKQVQDDQGTPEGFIKPGADMIVKRNAETSPTPAPSSFVTPKAIMKVKNKRDLGEVCGTSVIQATSGQGKATLVLTISKAVEVTWTKGGGVTAGAVSATMGFDVTKKYTVENQSRLEVPKGKFGYIKAYPLYNYYTWDAYMVDRKIKSGSTLKPIGVCFNQGY